MDPVRRSAADGSHCRALTPEAQVAVVSMQLLFTLTRFLPQISLRNLRKLDCYANRYPLRWKTL
jgi:hypothetical protein